MSGVWGEEGRFRWLAALLLGGAGLLLNLLPLSLSPGTDLVLGGVAYLLAAVALGPLPGLLAAALASARTLWLWNHPYAWLIFAAEALVVGAVVARGRRPIIADLLYWLCCGVPLLFLTYHLLLGVSGTTAAVLFLKQPLNGLIDALLVEMLLLFPAVRRWLRVREAPRLESALAVVVAMAAVVPALGFGVWMGREEWSRNLARAHERLSLVAGGYASKLEQYVLLHERAVHGIARSAERRGEFDVEQLQRLVAVQHEQFPGFIDVYAADSRGRAVAFAPLVGARGDSLIGLNFSDRPYFLDLRYRRETVISDVFPGRGGADEPLVILAEPIVLADTFAGYVLGALDLKALPRPDPTPTHSERLRVADVHGSLVYDSWRRYHPGELPRTVRDSLSFAAIRQAGEAGSVVYPAPSPPTAASMVAARLLAGVGRLPALGWWVWVEQPFAIIQAFVADSHLRLFTLLIVVVVLAIPVSTLLSRFLARPLLRLRAATGALAAGDLSARVGRVPASAPTELHELGRGFDEMAEALERRTEELEELGEIARSLTSTLEVAELLRRITDAAARLVEPDGCGIALLDARRQVLTSVEYGLGLLAPPAGHVVPLESSLLGWVVRSGQPALVPDASGDPRVFQGYVGAAEVRSIIAAPLVGRARILGTLTAVRGKSSPRPFTPADLRRLERLAGSAAIAVENARLLEAAEAASRAKSDFIAAMSHELRTPLNAVLGHLELLELGVHGPIPERQLQALGRIRSATRHLRALIEEVLSLAQLEAGRLEARVSETDVCALAREVASLIEPLARDKGLGFSVACAELPALVLRTDPDKVRQVLINLAGNAVKFTERGEVRIAVEQRDGAALLAVTDTGIGISPGDRERLFQPFEQLESGLSRAHGGTGLGLYLSSRYAEQIGGRIEVESVPGRGSTFTLVLTNREQGTGDREQ